MFGPPIVLNLLYRFETGTSLKITKRVNFLENVCGGKVDPTATTTFAQIFLKVILFIKILRVLKTNKLRKYLNWHGPKANGEQFPFIWGGGGGHWITLGMCELYI